MKRIKLFGALLGSSFILAACDIGFEASSVEPMTFSEVSAGRAVSLAQTLSQTEQEKLVYSYINNSILVTEDNLIKVGEAEFKEVEKMLTGIDKVVQGKEVKKPDGTEYITRQFTNALLMEFARTPYTWNRVSQEAIGFDASSRMYFIDVVYKTTDEFKKVIPDSTIVSGSEIEEQLKAERYSDYTNLLSAREDGGDEAQTAHSKFQSRWGSIGTILEEQQGDFLVDRISNDETRRKGLGGMTYSGLLEDNNMKQGATMTVRYIFKYNYNLGEETSLSVDSLYIKNYELDGHNQYTDLEEDKDALVAQSLDLLKPFIKNTLISYQRAVPSYNKKGLHSMYVNYGKYDKYYAEQDAVYYTNYGNLTIKVIKREGTLIQVIVDRQVQTRPKGSKMTMPTYREKVLYNMEMSRDDKVRIKNSYLLQRILVGEPTSIVKNIDGVSNQIQYSSTKFSEANEQKVIDTLKNFMQIVYENDTSSQNFADTIDLGIGAATMARMMEHIGAVESNRKYNYIISWGSRTNSYVSLNIREIFEVEGYNLDTESIVELVNRGNSWHVINYNRTVAIKNAAGKIASNKGVFSMNTSEGSVDVRLNEDTGKIEEAGNPVKGESSVQERIEAPQKKEPLEQNPEVQPLAEPAIEPVDQSPVEPTVIEEPVEQQVIEQEPVVEVEEEQLEPNQVEIPSASESPIPEWSPSEIEVN